MNGRPTAPDEMDPRKEIGALLESGEASFFRGDLASAMRTFLRVLDIDGTNAQALNNLGVIQWHFGDADSAIETFQVALRFDPEDPDALSNLARAAAGSGRFDLADPDRKPVLNDLRPGNDELARLLAPAPEKDPLLKRNVSTRAEGRVHIDSDRQPVGVSAQFLENAETYHERYFNNDYWKHVVTRALDLSGVDRDSCLRILDIGSGSGNTVFAAAELMPNSVIIANDISPQLLQILVRIQERVPALNGRIKAYCFDLHKDFFADDSFDLVLGGAVLHHMLDPEAALRNAARWLRPGGKILLAEPLEIGGHVLTAIYLTLLSELESEADPRLLRFFKEICADFEARFGVPRVKPWTHNLDDKWFFHEPFLRRMAGNIGLTLEQVAPIGDNLENAFSDTVSGHIKAAGLDDVPIPEKTWEILKCYDTEISPALKKRFVLEGIIVLAKPRTCAPMRAAAGS